MSLQKKKESAAAGMSLLVFDRPCMVDTRKETRSQNSRTQDTVRQSDGREGEEIVRAKRDKNCPYAEGGRERLNRLCGELTKRERLIE